MGHSLTIITLLRNRNIVFNNDKLADYITAINLYLENLTLSSTIREIADGNYENPYKKSTNKTFLQVLNKLSFDDPEKVVCALLDIKDIMSIDDINELVKALVNIGSKQYKFAISIANICKVLNTQLDKQLSIPLNYHIFKIINELFIECNPPLNDDNEKDSMALKTCMIFIGSLFNEKILTRTDNDKYFTIIVNSKAPYVIESYCALLKTINEKRLLAKYTKIVKAITPSNKREEFMLMDLKDK